MVKSFVFCLVVLVAVIAKVQCKSVINNIVVLMMENRSFDNLLGFLKADYNSKIEGLSGGETCPRDPNDPSKGSVPVTRNGYDISPDDPKHGFDDIAIQINNNAMNGFVSDAISVAHNETNPVSMFDSTSAPIINQLAREFAVFDHWHCSLPGPTDPNRAFAMSGTSQGVITNYNGTLWSQQSYFDYLRQHDRTFAGYFQKDMWALYYFEDTNKPENSQFIRELDHHFWDDVAAGRSLTAVCQTCTCDRS
jgi:phospholipase C